MRRRKDAACAVNGRLAHGRFVVVVKDGQRAGGQLRADERRNFIVAAVADGDIARRLGQRTGEPPAAMEVGAIIDKVRCGERTDEELGCARDRGERAQFHQRGARERRGARPPTTTTSAAA